MKTLEWDLTNVKDERVWVSHGGRFRVQWAGRTAAGLACTQLWDSEAKQHIYGFRSDEHAKDLALHILRGTVHKVGLVACSKEKRAERAYAFMLYTSDLFRKARDCCIHRYDQWFILSAKHGLVKPKTELDPYDDKLTVARSADWAWKVKDQLAALFNDPHGLAMSRTLFYAHAGQLYTTPLLDAIPMVFPVKGLGIGEQLAWYKKHGKQSCTSLPT